MTWVDQRPQHLVPSASPVSAPSRGESWTLSCDLWSIARPVDGFMGSALAWWLARSSKGKLIVDEQGIKTGSEEVAWRDLRRVQLEVWLVSNIYLELYVALQGVGQGAQAGPSVSFKVRLPHVWISASAPLKERVGVGYVDVEAFVAIWSLVRFFAQLQDISVEHLVSLKSVADARIADVDWRTRRKIDDWLKRYDAQVEDSFIYVSHDLNQAGFDYLFGRLSSWPMLRSLGLEACSSLKHVDGLSNFTNLTSLYLHECGALKNLDGLTHLTRLQEIRLFGGVSLESVDGLANLTDLRLLRLWGCESLPRRWQGHFSGEEIAPLLKSIERS